jgi:A/G-specific adenine glycosylase
MTPLVMTNFGRVLMTKIGERPTLVVMEKFSKRDADKIVSWYRTVKRDLPWRKNRDPYRIWLSEVMLQQTTVAAVVPFYERFIERFPTLIALSKASPEDVMSYWAGLGYYSRARNLHKAAKELVERGGFPESFAELLELPGFGPYTARAVASLAFDEKVGVLDGNVIRLLSRRYGLGVEFWKPAGREQLQILADKLAQVETPADLNQGMMELGATICTPYNPACLLCPLNKVCVARLEDKIEALPLKKPRRAREIWIWKPSVIEKRGQIALIENSYAPFLKGHWICPGEVKRATKAPKAFNYRHAVTHHDIFVVVSVDPKIKLPKKVRWVPRTDLKKHVPTTLVRKAIETRSPERKRS